MDLQLMVTVGPDMGSVFELTPGKTLVLGRGEDCDIQLADARISRNHCEIAVEGSQANLKDLGSTWGTLVNGEKVETHRLQPHDVITLSETQLRFEVIHDAVSPTWNPSDALPIAQPVDLPETKPSIPKPAMSPKPSAGDTALNPPLSPQNQSLESLVGQAVHRYQVQSILAKSKSGMVFRALDTKKQRAVALKVLRPEFAQNEEDVNRFVRAIKTMMGIRHENLVRVYGAGKTGAVCWTASELLEADSLTHLLEQAGPEKRLPYQQVVPIALDMARALEAASEHQIIHRNLTPNNVLVNRKDGRAKLGDLMLAKALEGGPADKITKPGETVGDLPYLAPEQLRAVGVVDARADIYSLGATLYTALTGRPPVGGDSLSEMLRNIENSQPAPLRSFHSEIPLKLDAIVMRMLAKYAEDRPASASELVKELETLFPEAVPNATPAVAPPVAQPVSQAKPAVPKAQVVPASQPNPATGWIAPDENQSVTAKFLKKKAKKKNPNQAMLIYLGGVASVLLLVVIMMALGGVFSGDPKKPPQENTVAKAEENETENSVVTEPEPAGPPQPMQLPELIKTVEPSVVRIDVTSLEGHSNGSGFVIDQDGTLVTNFHVIEGATRATAVFADGKQVRIEGVWHTDPKRDIAILQLNTFGVDVVPLKMVEGIPPKGESVVAFGAPLGFDFTASEGIVSGIRRSTDLENVGIGGYMGTWIQTTAPISQGNSGGPLVNRLGEVVAVNALTYRLGQNLNLAISARDVREALADRASEPETLAALSKRTLQTKFGLGEGGEPTFTGLEIDPKTEAELKRLIGEGSQQLKSFADDKGPLHLDQKNTWKRELLTAYEKIGKRSPSWDHQATLILQLKETDKDELQEAAKIALAADCEDPAVKMVCAMLTMPSPRSLDLAKESNRELNSSKYPSHLRHKLRLILFVVQAQHADEREHMDATLDRIMQDYLDTFRDPTLTDLERRMTYDDIRKTLGTMLRGRELELLKKIESDSAVDPWLREMLMGCIHHTLGWQARGSGYSHSVTKDQWEIFHSKMEMAQGHWLKAWQIHPDYPEAATELLRATMAYKPVMEGADERFWFERAVDAQFDYETAYQSYLWSIRPRWGGSHGKMLAFGRECYATKRYDTHVPWQFHEAVQAVASELDNELEIYRRFGVADDYLDIIKGYRALSEDKDRHNFLDSQIACILILSGRREEAKTKIAELGDDIVERGFETFDQNMESLLKQVE